MAVPTKVTVTQIQTGDPVNPAFANAPHTDLETNVDNILTYIDSGGNATFDNDTTTTTGLTFGYLGGSYRENNVVVSISDGSVLLTASSTNYVELNKSGVIVSNAVGFTVGSIPLWEVVTDVTTITGSTDKRAWMVSTDADNINVSSSALISTNVRAGLEEVNSNSIAMSVVFGG